MGPFLKQIRKMLLAFPEGLRVLPSNFPKMVRISDGCVNARGVVVCGNSEHL